MVQKHSSRLLQQDEPESFICSYLAVFSASDISSCDNAACHIEHALLLAFMYIRTCIKNNNRVILSQSFVDDLDS